MRFLLSIHDVWPGNSALVSGYLARLRSLGARKAALLVVPAYHGRTAMEADPEFLAWLREESAAGTELFLHGYRHKISELVPEGADRRNHGDRNPRRNAWGRFVNRKLVEQEAEFCGLPADERERLLDLGMTAWSRTGLPVSGFIAPTWHGAPTMAAMRERKLGLWESRFRIHRLDDGESRFAPPLAWDLSRPEGGPRLFGGDAWLRLLTSLPLIKIAIHPGDFAGDGKRTEAVLERVFAAGTNIAYNDVFGPAQGV